MDQETKRIFWVWWAMRMRCEKESDPAFPNYGGRGITVCERWQTFANFLADMGPRPCRGSIERVDNNLGYSPENCRWATRLEQNNNRRNCIMVDIDGSTMTLKQACRLKGLAYRSVHKRIMARGWDAARALSTPIGKGNTHAIR